MGDIKRICNNCIHYTAYRTGMDEYPPCTGIAECTKGHWENGDPTEVQTEETDCTDFAPIMVDEIRLFTYKNDKFLIVPMNGKGRIDRLCITHNDNGAFLSFRSYYVPQSVKLPDGEYKLIGQAKDLVNPVEAGVKPLDVIIKVLN
ncbi:MAG: hypothetical protein H6550_16160 [Chitinophagales bacterium]|nr:hypothetical protein [Chitinophagales bacterium]